METLTPTELCERWRVTASTLQRMEARNVIVPQAIAGQSCYSLSVVNGLESLDAHEYLIERVMLADAAEHGIDAAAEMLGVDAFDLTVFVDGRNEPGPETTQPIDGRAAETIHFEAADVEWEQ